MELKYSLDMHTHTLASGHAYSTINEMAKAAAEKGLTMLGITEHSSAMPNGCSDFYLTNLGVVDRELYGVELLLGAELNIIDYTGRVDVEAELLKRLDLCIASLHTPCIPCGNEKENTSAILGAMENPYVHIIGHPDDGRYPVDFKEIVAGAKRQHVLLEVNNNSLVPNAFRLNARENDRRMLEICATEGQPVIIGSDAHWMGLVGRHDYAMSLIEEIHFPMELVMNYHPEQFKAYVDTRKGYGKEKHE
jgi:putative hydrolase